MAPKPCLEPDCPNLSYKGSRCTGHARVHERARGAHRKAYEDPTYRRTRRVMIVGASCDQCGARNDLTVDHIRPLAKGGSNLPDNLMVLCRRCNARKGSVYPAEEIR